LRDAVSLVDDYHAIDVTAIIDVDTTATTPV